MMLSSIVLSVVALPLSPKIASAADYWTVLASVKDEEGSDVPIRQGDATIGYTKACQTHNLCAISIIERTIASKSDLIDKANTRRVYQGHIVGGDAGDVTIRVVADLAKTTQRGNTPDGRPFGVITAYCEGFTRCPDAVNGPVS